VAPEPDPQIGVDDLEVAAQLLVIQKAAAFSGDKSFKRTSSWR
jgi:hypothetical protein